MPLLHATIHRTLTAKPQVFFVPGAVVLHATGFHKSTTSVPRRAIHRITVPEWVELPLALGIVLAQGPASSILGPSR